jgi:hypothetical protein
MTNITASQKTALLKLPGFKEIQKQYAKESKMVGMGKKRMKGRGFWEDVEAWFVQADKDITKFVKDTKIISNIASVALPVVYGLGASLLTANPIAGVAAGVAGKSTADYIRSQGYGATMKGKGLIRQSNGAIVNQKGNGIVSDFVQTFYPIAGMAINKGLELKKNLKSMRGGDARLVINPVGQRLMGRGLVRQSNGAIVNQKGGRTKMAGGGAGTEYNTVSSAFGEIVR